jgi:hypothetical protein
MGKSGFIFPVNQPALAKSDTSLRSNRLRSFLRSLLRWLKAIFKRV